MSLDNFWEEKANKEKANYEKYKEIFKQFPWLWAVKSFWHFSYDNVKIRKYNPDLESFLHLPQKEFVNKNILKKIWIYGENFNCWQLLDISFDETSEKCVGEQIITTVWKRFVPMYENIKYLLAVTPGSNKVGHIGENKAYILYKLPGGFSKILIEMLGHNI